MKWCKKAPYPIQRRVHETFWHYKLKVPPPLLIPHRARSSLPFSFSQIRTIISLWFFGFFTITSSFSLNQFEQHINMAVIVCHGGYQSYLESQLVESRIHRLMLPSPKPLPPPQQQQQPIDLPFKSCLWESNTKPHCDENSYKTNTTVSSEGWSSIQDLSSAPKESITTSTYVHPNQMKQSLVRLSPKSLELCTENLGNETGSDMVESDIELLSSSSECGEAEANSGMREQKRKTREARNFPPPLTTIRGTESIRVKPHREGGRLVLQVTKVNVPSCFQAERSHGRLRLCFWTNETQHYNDDDDIQEEFQSETNGQSQTQEEVEDNKEEVDEIEKEEENEGVVDCESGLGWEYEYIKGCNSWSVVEDVVRVEKKYERAHSRRRRCKEGDHENKELLITNWGEPLWVATS